MRSHILIFLLLVVPGCATNAPCDNRKSISVDEVRRSLSAHSRILLSDVVITGKWMGPPADAVANQFVCIRCCFRDGMQIVDQNIHTQVDFRDVVVTGVVLLLDSTFESPFVMRNSIFNSEFRTEKVKFESDVDLEGSTFNGSLYLGSSIIKGMLDLSRSQFTAPVKIFDTEIASSVHWEEATFRNQVSLEESGIAGNIILRSSRFAAPFTLLRTTVQQDADFRFVRLTGCGPLLSEDCPVADGGGSLVLSEGTIIGLIWLQSLEHQSTPLPVLRLSGTHFGVIEGKTWPELKAMVRGEDLLVKSGRPADIQHYDEHLKTLRLLEQSFRTQGLQGDADEVLLHRKRLEADREGFHAKVFHQFMVVSSRYGHSLWRLPAWSLLWVVVFASLLARGKLAQRRLLLPAPPTMQELWESMQLFLNLQSPEGLFNDHPKHANLVRVGFVAQIVGFFSISTTALLLGAFISGQ